MIRELRYKLVEDNSVVAEGTGQTIDIGSGGVSFIVSQALKVGAFIELSISWPVLLEEYTRMRLVVFGRMVRCSDRIAACTIDKYEFRTQARVVTAEANVRRDSMLQRWVEEMQKDVLKTCSAMA
jgi:hypothetical protein